MRRNESFVFFREASEGDWPRARSASRHGDDDARDRQHIFPRAGLVLVDTRGLARGTARSDVLRFMADQDTGAPSTPPARGHLHGRGHGGRGPRGEQRSEGHLYYFFLKPSTSAARAACHALGSAKRTTACAATKLPLERLGSTT